MKRNQIILRGWTINELINSKRQPKNFKKFLTSAKFNNQEVIGVKKCENSKCGVCNVLIEGKEYYFKNATKAFEIRKNLTCNSHNVIYALECENCRENYIGLTQDLQNRTSLHKSNIKIEANRKYRESTFS